MMASILKVENQQILLSACLLKKFTRIIKCLLTRKAILHLHLVKPTIKRLAAQLQNFLSDARTY